MVCHINLLITNSTPWGDTEKLSQRRITLTIDNSFSAYFPRTHFTPDYSEDVDNAFSKRIRLTWLSPELEPKTSRSAVLCLISWSQTPHDYSYLASLLSECMLCSQMMNIINVYFFVVNFVLFLAPNLLVRPIIHYLNSDKDSLCALK